MAVPALARAGAALAPPRSCSARSRLRRWGYFVWTGTVERAAGRCSASCNQLLAAFALAIGTSVLINMGSARYVAGARSLPLAFMCVNTLTAGWMNLSVNYLRPQLKTGAPSLCGRVPRRTHAGPDSVRDARCTIMALLAGRDDRQPAALGRRWSAGCAQHGRRRRRRRSPKPPGSCKPRRVLRCKSRVVSRPRHAIAVGRRGARSSGQSCACPSAARELARLRRARGPHRGATPTPPIPAVPFGSQRLTTGHGVLLIHYWAPWSTRARAAGGAARLLRRVPRPGGACRGRGDRASTPSRSVAPASWPARLRCASVLIDHSRGRLRQSHPTPRRAVPHVRRCGQVRDRICEWRRPGRGGLRGARDPRGPEQSSLLARPDSIPGGAKTPEPAPRRRAPGRAKASSCNADGWEP